MSTLICIILVLCTEQSVRNWHRVQTQMTLQYRADMILVPLFKSSPSQTTNHYTGSQYKIHIYIYIFPPLQNTFIFIEKYQCINFFSKVLKNQWGKKWGGCLSMMHFTFCHLHALEWFLFFKESEDEPLGPALLGGRMHINLPFFHSHLCDSFTNIRELELDNLAI